MISKSHKSPQSLADTNSIHELGQKTEYDMFNNPVIARGLAYEIEVSAEER